ncbi:MAG: VWA domain-containing protein [Myxococcota bacterium]
MKFTTLALCSTLGMALTSAAVWGLTPPKAQAKSAATTTAKASVTAPATEPSGGGLAGLFSSEKKRGATFSVGDTLHVDGRLGHAALAAEAGGETFLMLTIGAAADQVASTTAPVNLSIVVDRSRSMEGQRMANALDAARGMVRRLRPGDSVSVVTYNSSTDVLVPSTVIDDRTRGDVLFSLRGVEARGHTCISCGLEAGITAMSRRPGSVNRMLLLSDGEANFGVRDVDGFRRIAESARSSDIAISTVGVDVDYNERVMFAVAQASTGRHYFVENTASLPKIFDEELSSLVNTVVNDARVEVDLAPGVAVLEVLDRSFRQDGNRLIVPFGSFAAGEKKTLLVRLRVPAGPEGERNVADVRTLYDDLARDTPGECQGQLVAALTDRQGVQAELDPIVEARVARSETAASLTRANALFSQGDVAAARQELGDNRGRIRRRKARASKKSSGNLKDVLGGDFEKQLKSLDEAERGFNEAPTPTSRKGKAQIRSNAGQLDELGL